MTKEKESLLLKDICARLPYGIICRNEESNIDVFSSMLPTNILQLRMLLRDYTIKPYLRPMSSMTEEERIEFERLSFVYDTSDGSMLFSEKGLDWLNAHHFDFRGLIEKGLALEATEEMYKTE